MGIQKNTLKRFQQGLTLIELIATLAVVSILLAHTAPALHNIQANNRLWTHTHHFGQMLVFARSEAIKRNNKVIVCNADNSNQCLKKKHWDNFWLVFEDRNNNGQWNSDEPLLKRLPFGRSTRLNIHSSRKSVIAFHGHGRSPGSNATFTFCDSRGAQHARSVILSNSGRYRMSDKTGSGKKLTCT